MISNKLSLQALDCGTSLYEPAIDGEDAMSPVLKFLIGLAAILLMGWISHGPLGNGERLIASLEAQAQQAVDAAAVPGVQVRLSRDPLARVAMLSGPANDFQREGMGQFPGLNDRVRAIEGIERIEWTNPPPAPIQETS